MTSSTSQDRRSPASERSDGNRAELVGGGGGKRAIERADRGSLRACNDNICDRHLYVSVWRDWERGRDKGASTRSAMGGATILYEGQQCSELSRRFDVLGSYRGLAGALRGVGNCLRMRRAMALRPLEPAPLARPPRGGGGANAIDSAKTRYALNWLSRAKSKAECSLGRRRFIGTHRTRRPRFLKSRARRGALASTPNALEGKAYAVCPISVPPNAPAPRDFRQLAAARPAKPSSNKAQVEGSGAPVAKSARTESPKLTVCPGT